MSDWTPTGLHYRVRLTRAKDQTASGIFLPDSMERYVTSADVLGVGPGVSFDSRWGGYAVMQVERGERVLFPYSAFEETAGLEGVVSDADVAAVQIGEEPGVEPLGEWLLVDAGEKIAATAGGFEVPDKYRKRARTGTVLHFGPGALRQKGDYRGIRKSCYNIMGVPDSFPLRGALVHWDKTAQLLILSGTKLGLLLVRARDLIAVEENEE